MTGVADHTGLAFSRGWRVTGWVFGAMLAVFHSASGGPTGVLELKNGDRLEIVVERYEPQVNCLVGRHAGARDFLWIRADMVRGYRLRGAEAGQGSSAPDLWQTEWAGGDRVFARVVLIDPEKVVLDHPNLGRWEARREHLASMGRSGQVRLIYEGPSPGETWQWVDAQRKVELPPLTVQPGEWAGRVMADWPRRGRLDIELQWTHPTFVVHFLATDPAGAVRGEATGYQLHYQMGHQIMLLATQRQANVRQLGAVHIGRAAARRARMTIYTDLDAKRVAVYLDGQRVGEWEDPQPLREPGRALVVHSGGGIVTLQRVRLAEWDGRLPREAPERLPAGADIVVTSGGDLISGTVVRFDNAEVRVKTAFGELTIPVGGIEKITMRATPLERVDLVRATLRDGTMVALRLGGIQAGTLTGESPIFGNIRIPWDQIVELRWEPDPEAPSASSDPG